MYILAVQKLPSPLTNGDSWGLYMGTASTYILHETFTTRAMARARKRELEDR